MNIDDEVGNYDKEATKMTEQVKGENPNSMRVSRVASLLIS